MSTEPAKAKPTLPEGYVLPKVWKQPEGESMGGMNRPTAGARVEKDVPVGKHDLQLYSLGTPNGQKVTIMLEELHEALGLEYDAWLIEIWNQEQFTSGFTKINPNGKIPCLMDHSVSPPLPVFESASILLYLAEKHKKFIPTDIAKRTEVMNWLFWQVGTAPYIGGGFGHFFKYAPITIEYCIDRFSMETKRIMDVLDKHLEGKTFIVGDELTIADIANYTWMKACGSNDTYKASEFLDFPSYKNLNKWITMLEARPAFKRGVRVNTPWSPTGIKERHSAKDFE